MKNKVQFSTRDINLIRFSLVNAIENVDGLLDAHSCHFCHTTRIFNDGPCICKTGYVKGSLTMVRKYEEKKTMMMNLYKRIGRGL